jgi:hypothetical protein
MKPDNDKPQYDSGAEAVAKADDPHAVADSDDTWVTGWYDDENGNSIKDRD